MTVKILSCLGLAALLFASCSTAEYYYVPAANGRGQTESAEARMRGEATYAIPAGAPVGLVRVRSFGVVELKPKGEGEKIPALHLRMSVSNQSNEPWTMNAQETTVAFANQGQSTPMFANSDQKSLPMLTVGTHELRSLDLYYPLPPGSSGTKDVPEFDFHWVVHLGPGLPNEDHTTAFARIEVRPPPDGYYYSYYGYPYDPYPYYALGWGHWWWGPGPSVRYRR